MDIKIEPCKLYGEIEAVSSKSHVHRLLISAFLSGTKCRVNFSGLSNDINATLSCLRALGAIFETDSKGVSFLGRDSAVSPTLNSGESGSTFRFMLPIATALCDDVTFIGEGRLPSRPHQPLQKALTDNGVTFSKEQMPYTTSGTLKSGTYVIPGNISSQFVTGLLFALPLLQGDSQIVLTTPLESKAYVALTLSVLSQFGIEIDPRENGYYVKGGQKYIAPEIIDAEGDWSNASYFLALSLLGSNVRVTGLREDSLQGDKRMVEYLRNIDADEVDVNETPDLFPTLAVAVTSKKGTTRLVGARRLRMKESDRIITTLNMLTSLGGNVRELDDGLEIAGGALRGGVVDGAGDHRIVMSAAIAATVCEGEVIIKNAEAVEKSYPAFFEDFKKLGGKCYVI